MERDERLGGNRLPEENWLMSKQINVRMDRDLQGGPQTRLFCSHLVAYPSQYVLVFVE
jgi:hypothetical protein